MKWDFIYCWRCERPCWHEGWEDLPDFVRRDSEFSQQLEILTFSWMQQKSNSVQDIPHPPHDISNPFNLL